MQVNNRVLHPLMNIEFPEEGFLDVPELFYRSEKCLHVFNNGMRQECRRYSFDTWMSLFAVKKWRTYCEVDGLFLCIHAQGKLQVELIGHKLDAGFGLVSDTLETFEWDFGRESLEEFPVDVPESYDAVSLHAVMADGSAIKEAAWCTDSEPLRQNRIAIVSCTFRREKYINATMNKFKTFMEVNPEMQDRFHLFVVDNGKTLEKSESPYITVIPNMNAGGAGGFARGLMEANDGDFSRCLFLDDDVQIISESFYRTLMVADYLREEYKDAFISGAMMNLHKKTLCTESLTVRDGFWIRGYHPKYSVVTPYDILRCIHVDPHIFDQEKASSSWWFACFSLESMGDEYPIPAFIRGDDAEWSWRRFGTHHIVLNGICVWHLPWEWKTNRLVDRYYLPRNMFLAHTIHDKKFQKEFVEDYMTHEFDYLVKTFDYPAMDLFLASMRDILKGREAFAENSVKQRKRLERICQKPNVYEYKDKVQLISFRNQRLRDIRGRKGVALDFGADLQCYKDKSEVKAYHLLRESYELRIRDEEKERRAWREFNKLLYLIGAQYENLSKHLHKCHEEFKTRKFWNEYLELER